METDISTRECIENIRLARNSFVLIVYKPIRNFPNVSGFRVKLDLSDIDYADLLRAMGNLFDRYLVRAQPIDATHA
jgi:hypothetical protein